MSRILILYSTVDGQTLRICERMKAVVEALGNEVVLASIDDSDGSGMSACDKVVIGASIRYGKHRQSVFDFIETNRRVLDAVPTAFFSVNIVARKAEKSRPETNPYVRKFLARTSWRPTWSCSSTCSPTSCRHPSRASSSTIRTTASSTGR